MSRFLATGIGKRTILNEPEGLETPAIDREDYLYKVAIIFDSVILYSQFNPNPDRLYYKYTGPLTEIELSNGSCLCILCEFNRFDEAYFKYYTEKQILIRPN